MKVAFYARVSRDDLHCENQLRVLRNWKASQEVADEDCEFFVEEQTTRKSRPIKESMIKRFREGEFNTIVCSRIDRFARSSTELILGVREIIERRGRWVSVQNGMDFSKTMNASQMLQFQIFAAFAEFERELIRERTLEGLARVKAQGKKLGRPFGWRKHRPPQKTVAASSSEATL